VARIEVGGSFDEAPDHAFRPLAGFIDGANRSRRQIAMTAPVTQQKAGPEQIAMTARWCSKPPAGPVRTAGLPASTSAIPSSSIDTTPDRAYRTPS
jgi:SOUL heme-binding protein